MQLLDSGKLPVQQIMELDAILLNQLESESILHLYEMEGRAATFGLFSRPEELLNLAACSEQKVALAKRPTGGGIIFHFLDLAFSYLVPKGHPHFSENTLKNYQTINSLVGESLKLLLPGKNFAFLSAEKKGVSTFCMAHPTAFDLLCEGKKLVGAAQRKTKRGLLHQGSISILQPPRDLLLQLLEPHLAEEMLANSYYLTKDPAELTPLRKQIRSFLIKQFDL